jgi:5-methylcytosine-specific restriction endonuclease McrA
MDSPKMSDDTSCAYCGGIALEWDHVVPVRALRPDSHKEKHFQADDWVVPSCKECNDLLADRMLHTVPLRAGWLYNRYRKKYAKLMTSASWTDEELDELRGTFKLMIIETMLAQAELDHRLAHLRKIAAMSMDYMQPKYEYKTARQSRWTDEPFNSGNELG